jgi:hypothetical protein
MTRSTALATVAALATLGAGMTRANASPEWMAAVRRSADQGGITQLAWLTRAAAAA